jgi:hypothetical protein
MQKHQKRIKNYKQLFNNKKGRRIMKKRRVTHHQYRLNSNAFTDVISVDQIKLSKQWTSFDKRKEILHDKIKTKLNKEGMIDYREIDVITEEEIISSVKNYRLKTTNYLKKDLNLKERDELILLAKRYDINPINKRNEFLINLILDKQTEYQKVKNEEDKDES